MDTGSEAIDWGESDWPPYLTVSGANYDAQLRAAHALLSRQDKWSATTTAELVESERRTRSASGDSREWLVDQHIELIEQSIYEDAAKSMAAVGMLAPLVESFFRRVAAVMDIEWPRRQDVVKTIAALVTEKGITPIPDDLEPTLTALFDYRNMMFHIVNADEILTQVRRCGVDPPLRSLPRSPV